MTTDNKLVNTSKLSKKSNTKGIKMLRAIQRADIDITEKHIVQGVANSPFLCPLSFAVMEADDGVRICQVYNELMILSYYSNPIVMFTHNGQEFLEQLDSAKPVKPFTLSITRVNT